MNPESKEVKKERTGNNEMSTWQIITASAVALLVIWIVLRCLNLLVSSFILYYETSVPFSLLLKRENNDVSNIQLVYLSVILLLTLTSYTRINPLPECIRNKIASYVDIVQIIAISGLLLYWLWYVIRGFSMFLDLGINKNMFRFFRMFACYILSFCEMLYALSYGREYFTLMSEKGLSNTTILSFEDTVGEIIKGDKDIWENQRIKKKINARLKRIRIVTLLCSIILVISIFVIGAIPEYCMFDGSNRFIVAVFGDKCIVQEAIYDSLHEDLYVDTTSYFMVDNLQEEITIHSMVSGEIKKMSKK